MPQAFSSSSEQFFFTVIPVRGSSIQRPAQTLSSSRSREIHRRHLSSGCMFRLGSQVVVIPNCLPSRRNSSTSLSQHHQQQNRSAIDDVEGAAVEAAVDNQRGSPQPDSPPGAFPSGPRGGGGGGNVHPRVAGEESLLFAHSLQTPEDVSLTVQALKILTNIAEAATMEEVVGLMLCGAAISGQELQRAFQISAEILPEFFCDVILECMRLKISSVGSTCNLQNHPTDTQQISGACSTPFDIIPVIRLAEKAYRWVHRAPFFTNLSPLVISGFEMLSITLVDALEQSVTRLCLECSAPRWSTGALNFVDILLFIRESQPVFVRFDVKNLFLGIKRLQREIQAEEAKSCVGSLANVGSTDTPLRRQGASSARTICALWVAVFGSSWSSEQKKTFFAANVLDPLSSIESLFNSEASLFVEKKSIALAKKVYGLLHPAMLRCLSDWTPICCLLQKSVEQPKPKTYYSPHNYSQHLLFTSTPCGTQQQQQQQQQPESVKTTQGGSSPADRIFSQRRRIEVEKRTPVSQRGENLYEVGLRLGGASSTPFASRSSPKGFTDVCPLMPPAHTSLPGWSPASQFRTFTPKQGTQ